MATTVHALATGEGATTNRRSRLIEWLRQKRMPGFSPYIEEVRARPQPLTLDQIEEQVRMIEAERLVLREEVRDE